MGVIGVAHWVERSSTDRGKGVPTARLCLCLLGLFRLLQGDQLISVTTRAIQ
jgi:hypothetical protein